LRRGFKEADMQARIGVAPFRDIALGAQAQIAILLASDGETIVHPEPARFFEVPIQGPLPGGVESHPVSRRGRTSVARDRGRLCQEPRTAFPT
jgi:hypothetical protein